MLRKGLVMSNSAGGPIKKTFSHLLLSEEEVEAKLQNGENKVYVNREGNSVKSWEINSLPSSDTGEDRYSTDVITESDLEKLLTSEGYFWKNWWNTRTKLYPNKQGEDVVEGDGKQDVMMFSVFDGHGGPYISDLLSRTLHGCLAWNIANFLNRGQNDVRAWEHEVIGGKLWSEMKFSDDSSFHSFLAFDANIIQSTWSTLFSPIEDKLPGLPPHSPTQLGLANLFDNGSCAITAIVDVESDKLYEANVGDTRAIAGWWNPDKGEWRCDILTEDATCENEKETKRRDTAIHNQGYGDTNRVLGGLQPSRAFGDDAYKIGYDDYKDIQRTLFQKEPYKRWKWFEECPSRTPPYVTARPEVAIRDIHPRSGEELKFVVLATDGLWDRVTSEEASHLVASHMMHEIHPDQSKLQVMASCPHTSPLPNNDHPFPKEDMRVEGRWVYEDTNAATHLIKNALGGDDRELRRQFLSLRSPGARSARDDTTAIVIWFDDHKAKKAVAEEEAEVRGDMTSA
ncbi:hypothetical protein L486_02641 [Kwoniella mangroviensis CBS 10435]|uniref:PPM-type phosphatase domain-containing protein n=1 Tax=Kwoniella mangroviensis CBS 10435 TaxID=1331196 RepID=A0A1B9IWS3_9TREE|nr:hypothetical protein L486_02641 [Kwoniella mangroviensis CBS 10435]